MADNYFTKSLRDETYTTKQATENQAKREAEEKKNANNNGASDDVKNHNRNNGRCR